MNPIWLILVIMTINVQLIVVNWIHTGVISGQQWENEFGVSWKVLWYFLLSLQQIYRPLIQPWKIFSEPQSRLVTCFFFFFSTVHNKFSKWVWKSLYFCRQLENGLKSTFLSGLKHITCPCVRVGHTRRLSTTTTADSFLNIIIVVGLKWLDFMTIPMGNALISVHSGLSHNLVSVNGLQYHSRIVYRLSFMSCRGLGKAYAPGTYTSIHIH